MTSKHQSLAAVGLSVALFCAGAAHAASQRTFVSGAGSDSNPCSLSAPCRSFAGALVNTLPGGEIYVLDTAGYGAVTINQSVSIINQTSTAGVTATVGAAITIAAGLSDKVVLRGLTIAGSAQNGVLFNTGGSLSVEDCSISGFIGDGILFIAFNTTSSAELHVSNTRVANNLNSGITVLAEPTASGTVKAVFERVEAVNNGDGIVISGFLASPGVSIFATVADSLTEDNNFGIIAVSNGGGGTVKTMVRNTVVSNNTTGIAVSFATLYVGHSTLSGNGTAATNTAGTLASYGDNDIDGNGSPGSPLSAVAFH